MRTNNAAFTLGVISLIISFTSICICIKYCDFRGSTTISTVVASLSILVSVLIGFQIYNIINLERRFEKVRKDTEKYVSCMGTTMAGVTLAEVGTSEAINHDYLLAAKLYLNALLYIYEGGLEDDNILHIANTTSQDLFNVICTAKKKCSCISFSIQDSIQAKYILAVERYASDEIRRSILDFIRSLKIISE